MINVKRVATLLSNNLLLLVALTGFVGTYKIQAEEECLSSVVLCYECDSRYDANCADPFDLTSISLSDQLLLLTNQQQQQQQQLNNSATINDPTTSQDASLQTNLNATNRQTNLIPNSGLSTTTTTNNITKPKVYPNFSVCHGCCVKITSKTPTGAVYVKRTCTTNLQINYFMVGLVCMKESGDRGKMCFCETDYCNGQESNRRPTFVLTIGLLLFALLANRLSNCIHP